MHAVILGVAGLLVHTREHVAPGPGSSSWPEESSGTTNLRGTVVPVYAAAGARLPNLPENTTMNWRDHFLQQTDYQIWANQVMFDSLARLQPDALGRPEGLFFSSIHHTTDHLLVVFRLWAARLRGEAATADFRVISQPDWMQLKRGLQHELRGFRHWLEKQPASYFDGRLSYARLNGELQNNAVSDILLQVMTHFVHHRGQISAVATRLGAPTPAMDYLYFLREMEQAAREAQQAAQQQQ